MAITQASRPYCNTRKKQYEHMVPCPRKRLPTQFEQRCAAAMLAGMVLGVLAAILLAVLVFMSGETFGQRCEAANPGASSEKISACVSELSSGITPKGWPPKG